MNKKKYIKPETECITLKEEGLYLLYVSGINGHDPDGKEVPTPVIGEDDDEPG